MNWDSLSIRAQHVAAAALGFSFGETGRAMGEGEAVARAMLKFPTARLARIEIKKRAIARRLEIDGKKPKSDLAVWQYLLMQKRCGKLTMRELFAWMSMRIPAEKEKPHTCVCRTCGRSM